jgi:hypothetical protein
MLSITSPPESRYPDCRDIRFVQEDPNGCQQSAPAALETLIRAGRR